MNYSYACELLEINPLEKLDENKIKKQYRLQALMYHPDKNNSPNACDQFQQIHDAYEYLMNTSFKTDTWRTYTNENENVSYSDLLKSFLQTMYDTNTNPMSGETYEQPFHMKIFNMIIYKLTECCEEKAIVMLKKIDKQLLLKIYELFVVYQHVFFISDTLLKEIYDMIIEKMKKDECIILHPLLEDLFEHNVYKLHVDNQYFLIPLWHHELIYDNSGSDLIVQCSPILPENISIDENNNLIVELQYNIMDIFEKEEISVEIGNQFFYFCPEELHLKKRQQIILKKKGISIINSHKIYDISNKANILFNIELC